MRGDSCTEVCLSSHGRRPKSKLLKDDPLIFSSETPAGCVAQRCSAFVARLLCCAVRSKCAQRTIICAPTTKISSATAFQKHRMVCRIQTQIWTESFRPYARQNRYALVRGSSSISDTSWWFSQGRLRLSFLHSLYVAGNFTLRLQWLSRLHGSQAIIGTSR